MNKIIDLFETDDPDQIADDIVSLVNQAILAHAYGEFDECEEIQEEMEEMVRLLAGAD